MQLAEAAADGHITEEDVQALAIAAAVDPAAAASEATMLFGRHLGVGGGGCLPGEARAFRDKAFRRVRARRLATRLVVKAARSLALLSAVRSERNRMTSHGALELVARLCVLAESAGSTWDREDDVLRLEGDQLAEDEWRARALREQAIDLEA